jgi:hypothetical protein
MRTARREAHVEACSSYLYPSAFSPPNCRFKANFRSARGQRSASTARVRQVQLPIQLPGIRCNRPPSLLHRRSRNSDRYSARLSSDHSGVRGEMALSVGLSNTYFKSLGLPALVDGCKRNQLEPPCTDPYARWCGRGRRATAAPMPIKSGSRKPGWLGEEHVFQVTQTSRCKPAAV